MPGGAAAIFSSTSAPTGKRTSRSAFPAPPQSRAEALAALKSEDAAARAEAVVWLANRGDADKRYIAFNDPAMKKRA